MARAGTWIAHGANGLIVGLMIFYALVASSWTGFIASDDVTFARGAYGWLEKFPYVGGHGTIRYTITIPMALAFRIAGENDFAMALPGLLYLTGFLVVAWLAVRRAAGPLPAFGALAALATSPLLVIQASIANVDVIELFFLTASVGLFWRCIDGEPRFGRLIAAGALAGAAFLTRETAIFIAVFYALYFLFGYRFSRVRYLWIAAGFIAVWAVELAYLWAMTGDPLYRFHISLHHDATIDRSVDLAGNVIVNPLIDPLLVLLLNQEFMLLFWIAPPVIAWLALGRSITPKVRRFARIIALFAAVWFVCVGAAQHLLPLNPRYFMICAAMASLLGGTGLVLLIARGGRTMSLAVLSLMALIGSNLAGIAVENKQSTFGERQLARIVAARPNAIVGTDPMTRYRADMLLRWEHARPRVIDVPPAPGSLFFYNPARAAATNFKTPPERVALYQPRLEWSALARYRPSPTWLARILESTGLAARIPQGVWHKLRYQHPEVTLYRVAPAAFPVLTDRVRQAP